MRNWHKASTTAVDERSMFQWPRVQTFSQSFLLLSPCIVIIWKTGVIRISSLIASTSISFVALLVNYSFEKPPRKDLKWMTRWPGLLYIEERRLHQKMHTWSTSKQFQLSRLRSYLTPNPILNNVHDTLIGVLKVLITNTWNALLRTFTGRDLSDTLVSLAPSTMSLCWYSIIKNWHLWKFPSQFILVLSQRRWLAHCKNREPSWSIAKAETEK